MFLTNICRPIRGYKRQFPAAEAGGFARRSDCAAADWRIYGTLFQVRTDRKGGDLVIVLIGFLLFLVGKLSVILHKQRISFGTRLMSERMANCYRLGYWLMAVGVLITFV
jgi:hypothetical protein